MIIEWAPFVFPATTILAPIYSGFLPEACGI